VFRWASEKIKDWSQVLFISGWCVTGSKKGPVATTTTTTTTQICRIKNSRQIGEREELEGELCLLDGITRAKRLEKKQVD
jgi:hypothetical protein